MNRRIPIAALAAATLVLLPAMSATAAAPSVGNGDFESDAIGSTTITAWTQIHELIDLGTTVIGGCTTEDTVDYTTTSGARADDLPPGSDTSFWQEAHFESSVLEVEPVHASPGSTSMTRIASLWGGTMPNEGRGERGYVAHGPAIVSDVFTTAGARQVSLDWWPWSLGDRYQVFGYVLDTRTCQQYEILDATGVDPGHWLSASVRLPQAGTYRVVLVDGHHAAARTEGDGGLDIDNVRVTPVFDQPGTLIEPLFDTGAAASGSQVQVSGSALAPESEWAATMIDADGAVTDIASGVIADDGAFWQQPALSEGLRPGKYELRVTASAADGPVSNSLWITVGAEGTITYQSNSGPEPIEPTGPTDPTDPTDPTGPTEPGGTTPPASGTTDNGSTATGATSTVAAAGTSAPQTLARTGGVAPSPLVPGAALGLVAAGILLVGARRLRRR